MTWACILYKGYSKINRLIGATEQSALLLLLVKCYIARLNSESWNSKTVPTQFQKSSSSYDFSALTLTEARIGEKSSVFSNTSDASRPPFVLSIDSRSTYDFVL